LPNNIPKESLKIFAMHCLDAASKQASVCNYVYVYICMCVYTHLCVCICMCTHTHTHTHTRTHTHTLAHTHAHTHTHTMQRGSEVGSDILGNVSRYCLYHHLCVLFVYVLFYVFPSTISVYVCVCVRARVCVCYAC
jgi:hypothetical protein